jgi:hypothetical protein
MITSKNITDKLYAMHLIVTDGVSRKIANALNELPAGRGIELSLYDSHTPDVQHLYRVHVSVKTGDIIVKEVREAAYDG